MLHRGSLALLAATLTVGSVAYAQSKTFDHPAPPEGMEFEPIEDNPYFVQDEDDPRILHRAPGFENVGIDRGYIEKMIRGGTIDPAMMDEIDRLVPNPPVALPQAPEVLANPLAATVVNGNIIIIEGTEAIAPNTQNGRTFAHNGNGLNAVISQVWANLGDNYDFITVFTTFQDVATAAYYMPMRQDVTGLGECNFNTGETFGCVFDQLEAQMQGFVFMNSLQYWRNWDWNIDGTVHPIDDFNSNVYAVLGQEVGHRWGAGLRFVDPRTGSVSKELLGRDNSHWAAYVDSDASVMDGWDWVQEADGGFRLVDDMRRFSTLDLYAMGALPVGAARPFFFIDNAMFDTIPGVVGAQPVPADAALQLPSVDYLTEVGVNLTANGERVDLTVQDIVDAEGQRCPDPDHTQKTFKQAIVLITQPGQSASQVGSFVQELETVRTQWEEWWGIYTDRALTLCTDVAGACLHGEASLGEGVTEKEDGSDQIEPGDKIVLWVDVGAQGDDVRNAVIKTTLEGNGAEYAEVLESEISIGTVEDDEQRWVEIPIQLSPDYACGLTFSAQVTLESENAQTKHETYHIFPGYKKMFEWDFEDGDEGFEVNFDELDENSRGEMVHRDVALSCIMSPRTPERDATPGGGGGAWVTGSDGIELEGLTSLWSPEIDLTGTINPEVRFLYWIDGEPGAGKLTVRLSTGSSFTEAKVYEEPYHGWVMGRVVIDEVYEERPDSIYVLFEFEGNGKFEGAIDDVRVLDRYGQCAPFLGPCACMASTAGVGSGDADTGPPGSAFAIAALAVILLRRRRRR
jgi:MYXO-CTERM domain-containing protein